MSAFSSPFLFGVVPEQSFWSRVLRRAEPERFVMVMRNLLAVREVQSIDSAEVARLIAQHRLDAAQTKLAARRLWRHAVRYFVREGEITDGEMHYLVALRTVLLLGEDDVAQVERELIHPSDHAAHAEALRDADLSRRETTRLDRISASLRLGPMAPHRPFGAFVRERST